MGVIKDVIRDVASELEDFEGLRRDFPVVMKAQTIHASFKRGYPHLMEDDFGDAYVLAAMGAEQSNRFRAMKPEHRQRVQRIHKVGSGVVGAVRSLEIMVPLAVMMAPVLYSQVLRQAISL